MCSCQSILECCVTFSGVKLSIRSFVSFIRGEEYKCSSSKIGIISIIKAIYTCASSAKRMRFGRLWTHLEVSGGFTEL